MAIDTNVTYIIKKEMSMINSCIQQTKTDKKIKESVMLAKDGNIITPIEV